MDDDDLSGPVTQAIQTAWEAMLSRPDHHLLNGYRRSIYEALGIPGTERGRRCHAWLGIEVAEKVLPIVAAALPEDAVDPDPHLMILLARDLAEGRRTLDDPEVIENLEASYHAYGNLDFEELPVNVEEAIYAARKALLAACGEPPLQYVDRVARLHGPQNMTSGRDMTDELLGSIETGDAAATGALAYSCRGDTQGCDPEQLQEYWRWWLYEAVPSAWRRAHPRGLLAGDAPSVQP